MDIVYIYGLIDPRNDKVFYIGFTQYLKRRYNVHLNTNGRKREKNLYKDNVINKILELGLKPQMIILDSCDKVFNNELNMMEHERLEKMYIKKYKDAGIKLTNLTEGGDGGGTKTKHVFQYSEEGDFIGEYNSVNEIADKYGVGADIISKVIDQRHKLSYRGTYLFSSKEKANLFIFKKTKKDNLPVLQYSLDGNFIREFKNQREASLSTNLPQPNINHCLRNNRNRAGNYVWKYKNN